MHMPNTSRKMIWGQTYRMHIKAVASACSYKALAWAFSVSLLPSEKPVPVSAESAGQDTMGQGYSLNGVNGEAYFDTHMPLLSVKSNSVESITHQWWMRGLNVLRDIKAFLVSSTGLFSSVSHNMTGEWLDGHKQGSYCHTVYTHDANK